MIQIKDGKISLNKTRTLTPKQQNILSRMYNDGDRNRYLMSIMGLIKARVFVPRIKTTGHDTLSARRAGSILHKMNVLKDFTADHRPSSSNVGQWLGVEIECFIPSDACDEDESHSWLRGKLRDAGLTRCSVKHDGSLTDDDSNSPGHSVEVTLLFNSAHGFEPLEKLCKTLNRLDCYVNKSCGLHVHLDARHLSPKSARKVGQSIGHALPVLKWIVDPSRHNNTYCPLKVGRFSRSSQYRYAAVNLNAYFKFKTIEVRIHGGSTNFKKIKSWIELIRLIGNSGLRRDLTTFQDFIDTLTLPDALTEYAEKRITRLNPDAWTILNPPLPVETPAAVPQTETVNMFGETLRQLAVETVTPIVNTPGVAS